MNKSKKLAFLSLLICFYFISYLIPIGSYLAAPKAAFILGIGFIFIEKRIRILITIIYQGYFFATLSSLVFSMQDAIIEIVKWSISDISSSPTSVITTSQISYGKLFFIYMIEFQPAFIFGTMILVLLFALFMFFVELGLCLYMFTQPYSIYLIAEKLGLYKLVSHRIGDNIF